MKKFSGLFSLALAIFLIMQVQAFGQGKGIATGGGNIWSDSLGTAFTSRVFNLDMKYQQVQVTVKDTGLYITDSVSFYAGRKNYNSLGVCTDTSWDTSPLLLKKNDEAGKFVTVTSAAGTITTYTIVNSNVQLLKALLVNVTAVTGRYVKVNMQGNQFSPMQNYDGTVTGGSGGATAANQVLGNGAAIAYNNWTMTRPQGDSLKSALDSLKLFLHPTRSIGQFPDTVTNVRDSILAPSGNYWDLTVAADDSTLQITFTSGFPSTDNFTMKVNESYRWNALPTSLFPYVLIRKLSTSAGACNYRVFKRGY